MGKKFKNPFKEDYDHKWVIPVFWTFIAVGMNIAALFSNVGHKEVAGFMILGTALIWLLYFAIILFPMD